MDIHASDEIWRFFRRHELRVAPTGLAEEHNSAQNINLYPNPFTDQLTIETEGLSDVQVYDLDGTLLKTIANIRNGIIETSELKAGVYFLHVQTKAGIAYSQPIVKAID